MEKSKPWKDDHARQNIAGSSRRRKWRCRTWWWPSTHISRASSGDPLLTFSSMRMLSQVWIILTFLLYDANLNMLLILLLSAFTAFNEEHFKQALERLDYVFAKYIFKVTSSQILLHENKIKLKRLPWNHIFSKGNIFYASQIDPKPYLERDFRQKLQSVRHVCLAHNRLRKGLKNVFCY